VFNTSSGDTAYHIDIRFFSSWLPASRPNSLLRRSIYTNDEIQVGVIHVDDGFALTTKISNSQRIFLRFAEVVSIRLGTRSNRDDHEFTKLGQKYLGAISRDNRIIDIEDPIVTTRNLHDAFHSSDDNRRLRQKISAAYRQIFCVRNNEEDMAMRDFLVNLL
jgi:hypothetical protein